MKRRIERTMEIDFPAVRRSSGLTDQSLSESACKIFVSIPFVSSNIIVHYVIFNFHDNDLAVEDRFPTRKACELIRLNAERSLHLQATHLSVAHRRHLSRATPRSKMSLEDEISVRRIKLSDDGLVLPLIKIFVNCLRHGSFPDIWKYLMT